MYCPPDYCLNIVGFDFILVYYEVTVLLRRWTFYCNWRTTSFYCIVLLYYCVGRYEAVLMMLMLMMMILHNCNYREMPRCSQVPYRRCYIFLPYTCG